MTEHTRRGLLHGLGGAAVAGAGAVVAHGVVAPSAQAARPAQAAQAGPAAHASVTAGDGVLDLYVNEGLVPMVDDSLVYMRGFGGVPSDFATPSPSLRISPRLFLADGRLVSSRAYPLDAEQPEEGRPDPLAPHPDLPGEYLIRRAHWASFFPDRTIVAEPGSTVRLRVHNRLAGPHELRVDGVATTGPIAPGATASLTFPAPAPGTYVYHDPGGVSVERILGLHGVLVVVANEPWRLGDGLAEFERQWVWICQDVDPVWGARARAGEVIDPVRTPPVPRYFMLNDRSGFRSLGLSRDATATRETHEDTLPSGSAREVDVRNLDPVAPGSTLGTGQMIRMVNLGAVIHQMHFHGNHVWTLRRNGVDFPRVARPGGPGGARAPPAVGGRGRARPAGPQGGRAAGPPSARGPRSRLERA